MFDVIKYTNKHLLFAKAEGYIFACILMGTVMNDTIHVELENSQRIKAADSSGATHVKAIELGYSVLCDELGDGGISLGEPSEEFGNTATARVSF
jgi:hypothetical protein